MSNNLGSIRAASINQSAQLSLDEASSNARSYLILISSDNDFFTKVAIAFGDSFDAAKLEGLGQEWLAGDFGSLERLTS